jgi:hypothetical protein
LFSRLLLEPPIKLSPSGFTTQNLYVFSPASYVPYTLIYQVECSPNNHTVFKIHFNIVFSSTLTAIRWCIFFMFSE